MAGNFKSRIFYILVVLFFCANLVGANEVPDPDNSIISIGQSSVVALNPKKINVLVWNTEKGREAKFRQALLDQAKKKDILILQEAIEKLEVIEIYQSLEGMGYDLAVSFKDRNGLGTGVMTGSRALTQKVDYQRSEHREGNGRFTPKIILFSQFALKGRSENLLVINIHGLNFVKDVMQQRQLERAMEVALAHKGPVVFAGDFNSWGPRRPRKLIKYMAENGFQEVLYPSNEGRTEGIGVGGYLDHIFVRGLGVESSLVRSDWVGSDHTALEASLFVL